MSPAESFERFSEGLKKAASLARELGDAQKNRHWNQIAFNLEMLLNRGQTIYGRRALSRDAVLGILDQRQKTLNTEFNS